MSIDDKLPTFSPEFKLLGLRLAEARYLLFSSFQSTIDVVRGHSSRITISVGMVHLDVLLDVTRPIVLSMRVHESCCSRLQDGLFGANALFELVLCTSRHFFSDLAEPKWSMLRDFL